MISEENPCSFSPFIAGRLDIQRRRLSLPARGRLIAEHRRIAVRMAIDSLLERGVNKLNPGLRNAKKGCQNGDGTVLIDCSAAAVRGIGTATPEVLSWLWEVESSEDGRLALQCRIEFSVMLRCSSVK